MSIQVLSENIDNAKRQHFIEIYKTTGAFNANIQKEIIELLRKFIPDSLLPDGIWDGWWKDILLLWLGISPSSIHTDYSRGCSHCNN